MVQKYADTFLLNLINRSFEDSRSGVEDNFWQDMKLGDLVFGRGWFGEYYDHSFCGWRSSIETGYMSLILRGGFIYLILYLLILGRSVYKGLFYSNNLFVKSFAIIILLSIINLYPYGWPAFDVNFLVIWIGVYICNQNCYLKLTDNEIKSLNF